jgi:sugar O-acyltransferase (sialic acid O-acetyltransferase NeuD family)
MAKPTVGSRAIRPSGVRRLSAQAFPVVIFAVGSPLVVDVVESLRRAGLAIRAGVHNVEGPSFLADDIALLTPAEVTAELTASPYVAPLFTPGYRQSAVRQAQALGFAAPLTLVDPTAVAPQTLSLGQGCYINAACSMGGASVFEDFVLINRGASIGHHVRLGRFVSIGPGVTIAGQVEIGRGALIGAGATVLPNIRIGANAVVGAGSVVTADVPDGCLAVGNPARVVKTGIGGYRGVAVD